MDYTGFKILVFASLFIGLTVTTAPAADQSAMQRFFSIAATVTFTWSAGRTVSSSRDITGTGPTNIFLKPTRKYALFFDAPYSPTRQVLSLRLIEFLDYIEDRFGPDALLTITSGYRPPEYNSKLRKKGALAAKASLHQYGMAADFILEGISSKRVWEYVRSIGFGGTGYYHGATVHVDVGPGRFWDEKSSGVGTGLSDDNKLIGMVTDYDVYGPGNWVTLAFIRMTAFPIKVRSEFQLISEEHPDKGKGIMSFTPDADETFATKGCGKFNDISQMASIRWRLPSNLLPGRYRIRAGFCDNLWEKMPDQVSTPEFEIRLP